VEESKNFVAPYEDRRDHGGHGTHVAGLLAGKRTGIAHGVRLYVAKVSLEDGTVAATWVTQGLRWALERDVDIISMSFGGAYNHEIWKLIQSAIIRGKIVVCSAGNGGSQFDSNVTFPASIGGVIRVGSTTRHGSASTSSSVGGPWITVAAPGEALVSTWPGVWYSLNGVKQSSSRYAELSGTSMATPLIAGLCAWLLAFAATIGLKIENAHCMESLLRKLCSNASGEQAKGNGIPNPRLILKSPDLLRVLLEETS
jgi:subtilisin